MIGQPRTRPANEQGITEAQDALYDALADESIWPKAMDSLVRCFSCEKGILHVREGGFTAPCSLAIPTGIDAESMRTYQNGFWKEDIWSQQADQKGVAAGDVVRGDELCADEQFLTTPFFNEFLAPQDIRHCLAGVADVTPSERMHLTVYRPSRSKVFQEQDRRAMRALLPAIRAATRSALQIEHWKSRSYAFEAALDHFAEAVIFVDAFAGVVQANAGAERLLRAGDVLTSYRGVLTGCWPNETRALHRAVRAAATPGSAPQPVVMTDRDGFGAFLVSPVPLRRAARARRETPRRGVPTVALSVAAPGSVGSASADLLQRMYGLTQAEARLVEGLANGASLPEFAERAGVSYETARTQLKAAFYKTGVRRQADLIALTLTLGRATPR